MNESMSIETALAYTCCPDCRGELKILASSQDTGLLCPACNLVFPTINGVLVLLDTETRNAELEGPLISKLTEQVTIELECSACKATLDMLSGMSDKSYAWEDEEHWSSEYEQQRSTKTEKNWNDRLWQRQPVFQFVVDSIQNMPDDQAAVVLDMGCGEGQDFHEFVAPVMKAQDIYIGLDISLAGLMLNRDSNPPKRAIYILGSADKPPLRQEIADAIICLGTLHHMQTKEDGLPIVSALLKSGVIVLSDPINGHFLPQFITLNRESRSAHDDSVDVGRIQEHIEKLGFSTLYERQLSGLVYIILLRVFRPLVLRSRSLHSFIHKLDDIFTRTLGRLGRLFKPRGLLLVLKSPPA